MLAPAPSLVPEPAYVRHLVRHTLVAGGGDTLVVVERAVVQAVGLLFAGVAVSVVAGLAAVAGGGHVREGGGS